MMAGHLSQMVEIDNMYKGLVETLGKKPFG
jgi:hypothetical protein